MTAVLADAVGPGGHVTAVDVADPAHGAPIRRGESAAQLLAGLLEARIDFRSRFDVLDPVRSFPDGAFDDVVLAQGAWQFQDLDRLALTLQQVRPWANRLCFVEWVLERIAFDQVAHLLVVLIRGRTGCARPGARRLCERRSPGLGSWRRWERPVR